jgi:hypothetical protein
MKHDTLVVETILEGQLFQTTDSIGKEDGIRINGRRNPNLTSTYGLPRPAKHH